MPNIKLPYTPESDELVENIKEEVEEVGGNITNAAERTQTMYPGGGKTGYNVPKYQQGGYIPYVAAGVQEETLESEVEAGRRATETESLAKQGIVRRDKRIAGIKESDRVRALNAKKAAWIANAKRNPQSPYSDENLQDMANQKYGYKKGGKVKK